MVFKLSSEDGVKFLYVHEESDYNNKIKSDIAMFPPLFPHYFSKFFI